MAPRAGGAGAQCWRPCGKAGPWTAAGLWSLQSEDHAGGTCFSLSLEIKLLKKFLNLLKHFKRLVSTDTKNHKVPEIASK